MPFLYAFIASIVLAIVVSLACLQAIIPPGEGSFGMAKAVPFIFIVLIALCFCLIWFPANLLTWFCLSPEKRKSSRSPIVIFSGIVFALAVVLFGWKSIHQRSYRIHFHYQLQDQFGQPVSGAKIRRQSDWQSSARDTEIESDANGLFEIVCHAGESFALNPRKNGYVLASLNAVGAWSEELRQKQKMNRGAMTPIVIKMWKLQGAEPLVGIDKEYKLPFSDRPIFFDLVTGHISESGGDLEIIITRASGSLSKKSPGDWSVVLPKNPTSG